MENRIRELYTLIEIAESDRDNATTKEEYVDAELRIASYYKELEEIEHEIIEESEALSEVL